MRNSLGGICMPQQKMVQMVADKIEATVKDRDLLTWSENTAAKLIEKLIDKATDDTPAQVPLCQLNDMMRVWHSGRDVSRRVRIIKDAMALLRQPVLEQQAHRRAVLLGDDVTVEQYLRSSSPVAVR